MARQKRPTTPEEIEKATLSYREKLIKASTQPTPIPLDPAVRAAAQLQKTEVMLEKSDKRRLALLLKAARLNVQKDEMAAVFALAAEIQAICRTRVLGLQAAHPVVAIGPPHVQSTAMLAESNGNE